MTDGEPPSGKYLDGKLSRGLVRQEARLRDKNRSEEARRLNDSIRPAIDALTDRGKIPAEMVRAFAKQAEGLVAASTVMMNGAVEHRFNAMLRNKAFAKFSGLHLTELDHNGFTILAERIHITPKAVSICSQRSPLSFTSHLSQRILERRRSELSSRAVADVGDALVASVGMICAGLRAAAELPEKRLAIPFQEGLILGEVYELNEPATSGMTVYADGFEEFHDSKFNAITARAEDCPFHDDKWLAFRGNTFIGDREMAPQQRALRDRMLALAEQHREAFAAMSDVALWPDVPGFDRPREEDEDLAVAAIHARGVAFDAIEDLLAVPGWVKAMGNSGVADPRPMGMRESIRIESRQWRDRNASLVSDEEIDEMLGLKGP